MRKILSVFIALLLTIAPVLAQGAPGGSGTAPEGFFPLNAGFGDSTSSYLLINSGGTTQNNYRTIALGTGLTSVDGGPKNPYTISVGPTLAYLTGLAFTTQQGFANAALNFSGSTSGDIWYNNAGNVARLPIGTNNQVLTVASNLPSWSTLALSAPASATILTTTNQVSTLPNSSQIQASSGITLTPTTNIETVGIDTAVVGTLTGTQTFTNKTLTAPIIGTAQTTGLPFKGSSFTDTVTITDPGANQTINIPNPGVSSSNFVLDQGATTIVGQKTFTASPILSTSTVTVGGNAVTFPSAVDTLANLSGTQTLNNKNLNAPTISGASTGITLQQSTANITLKWSNPAAARAYNLPDVGTTADIVMGSSGMAYTAGGIPWYNGNTLANAGAGTSGQYLQSNGASAPSWITPISQAFFPGGRLTTATGVAVNDTSSSGVTTIYYTPYLNNGLNIGGVNQTFAEASLALSTSANAAYDVLATSASSTTITLSTTPWTNQTTPETRFPLNGQYYSDAGHTHLVVGSINCITANTVLDFVGARCVSNMFNEVERPVKAYDATAGWTTTSTTPVAANGSTVNGTGQVQVFTCIQREPVAVRNFCGTTNATATNNNAIGIALDGTTVAQSDAEAAVPGGLNTASCSFSSAVLGFHTLLRQNWCPGGTSATFYGGTLGFMEGTCSN